MHILNPLFLRAVEEKDAKTLAAMAVRQAEAGADALDLNLGPARKNSSLLGWAMEVILEAVPLPLFAASQILAMPELLKRHQGRITVNSVTADPATLPDDMKRAQEHQAGLVVLLVRPGLTPFRAEDRLLIAAEVLETAARTGFPLAELHVDPLFPPSPDPFRQGMPDIDPVLETIAALPFLSKEKARSLIALSSASAFLPPAKRTALHRRLLPLLTAAGLDAVILGCHDRRLMEIARSGESPSAHPAGVYVNEI
jgi:cobalamin-dependent methionine synthase I